ncbi:hypothetical protein GCM10009733_008760 [Nonomuraea maheshkhaliensis]|uniref:Lipoprotein n=1 Tax=Nonomuraea maheshkhaliensis TaxID=419590 RepID=A0ABN2EQS9_9ACTN
MHARPRMLLAVLLGVAIASAGCGLSGDGGVSTTAACIDTAAKETAELRSAVEGLLPPEVTRTMTENNGCDAGSSDAYPLFEAGRAVPGYQLLEPFRENEWEVRDAPTDDCSYCVAGVSKAHAGRTVEVWVHDRSSTSPMEVEVQSR